MDADHEDDAHGHCHEGCPKVVGDGDHPHLPTGLGVHGGQPGHEAAAQNRVVTALQTAPDAPEGQNLHSGRGFCRFFKPKPKDITELLHIPVPAPTRSQTQDGLVAAQAEL